MIICIDLGGSLTKVAIKYDNKSENKGDVMEFKLFKFEIPYDYVNAKINELSPDDDVVVLITGARQSKVETEKIARGRVIFLEEIDSIGSVVWHVGKSEGLVVSLGTGTPYVYNDGVNSKHVSGTGLGGGTVIGLADRLIGETDPKELERLAAEGNVANVNIMMSDISDSEISWLKDDYTGSNFAKVRNNRDVPESREDLAAGIYSLVAEPIGCLAAACALGNNTETVIFVGMLTENKIIRHILDTCVAIYGLKAIYPEHSGFGTCLGAISLYERGGTDANKFD